MHISSAFDGGNVRTVEIVSANCARLEIVADPGTEFLHWFYFRCCSSASGSHKFHLINAGDSRTAEGWQNYRAFASYDRETWFRVPTGYRQGVLTISIVPEQPVFYVAHFPPYGADRLARLISWAQAQPGALVECIGESIEGRPIDLVRTQGEGPAFWIVAGQHPGEPMGLWFADGFLHRLLDPNDAVAQELRRKARFFIVPNANPDGSFHGRLRTNAAGTDLNRAWRAPREKHAPEIEAIIARMNREGIAFCLDVHGDETNPNCFIVNSDSVPGIAPAVIALRKEFEIALEKTGAGFRRGHGYKQEKPGTADLDIGANWITWEYGCLALTLEQPFKEGDTEWSSENCRALGAAVLDAMTVLPAGAA
jgi:murein tripeptide amidase MpaA